MPKEVLNYSSDHNWKYYGLSSEGTITKRFLRVERFHRGRFLFRKWFEEIAFCSEDAFIKWMVSTAESQKKAGSSGRGQYRYGER